MSFKKVLLVKPSGKHGLSFAFDMIPVGLEYIASSIEGVGDEVNIIDLEKEPKPIQLSLERYLDMLKPDLVGISMSATDHSEGLEIAEISHKRGIATVLGGYHPTAIPDEMLSHPYVDFVVRGEGEITMRDLVAKGDGRDVKGISYRDGDQIVHNPDREPIKDLDILPFPARHLRRHKYHVTLRRDREHDVLTASRGCWGKCSFCCEPSMSKSHLRNRAPEKVMDEILEIVGFHEGRPLSIEITDPHFMGRPRYVEQLCDLLAQNELDIKFIAKVRPDTMAKFPDVVRKMIAVGIDCFEMGIESPNKKDLESTSKGMEPGLNLMAVENIKKWGGNPGGTFVIGLPDQTEEEILQFPVYAKELGLTSTAYGIATPYPSTKFYEELDEQGLIFETDWNRFDEMHSVFKVQNIPSSRIEDLATICMAKFWTWDIFLERERMRMMRSGAKVPLATFAVDRMADLTFGASAGIQLQEGNFLTHIERFLEASSDPYIKRYTEKLGMHNVIEMSRFLSLLGAQTIQLTVSNNGSALTSWVFKTTKNKVEYVQVTDGCVDEPTINFEIDMADVLVHGKRNVTLIEKIRTITKLLASNKGIKRRYNLGRLLFAVGIEFLSYLGTRNNGKAID
ncbi:MAG: radical SAM protein [Thermoplasmata archaeon]